MKKVPIVLLILGGVLANFIGMVGCICMSILLFDIWSISCVLSLVIGGHVTGAVFLQRLYQRRWQIGKAIFWLCAGLPSALIGMSSFAVVLILDKLNYFSGFFAGLGEFVLTLAICSDACHSDLFRRVLRGSGDSSADNSCCFSHQKSEIARKNLNLTEFVI